MICIQTSQAHLGLENLKIKTATAGQLLVSGTRGGLVLALCDV